VNLLPPYTVHQDNCCKIYQFKSLDLHLCQQLKAEDRTRQIPVILMSANPHTREIARAVGADNEVMKPFDPTQLLALLSTYLNRE